MVNPVSTPPKPTFTLTTRDGLQLGLCDDAVTSLPLTDRQLALPSAFGGFLVRDVATDSDFFSLENGTCPELGLELNVQFKSEADHLTLTGRVTDTTGRDRAVTLMFALPLDASGS